MTKMTTFKLISFEAELRQTTESAKTTVVCNNQVNNLTDQKRR